jgi:hypothetical protein
MKSVMVLNPKRWGAEIVAHWIPGSFATKKENTRAGVNLL